MVVQWLGLCALTAEGPGLIPGWGTQAAWRGQKKTKNKTLKIELPCDPAIPGYTSKKTKTLIQKDKHTPIFIATLFTTAKIWNNLSVHQQVNG